METRTTSIPGVVLVRPRRFEDERGAFCETYREDVWSAAGVAARFVQDNTAWSLRAGTVRGLHFQVPPHAQAKLVRVVRGRIFDVVVDLREDSPTFRRWEAFELDAASRWQLFVPKGLAHGYMTMEDDTEVAYKVDAYYAPSAEAGIRWDDPDLAISWPSLAPVVSQKDHMLPLLVEGNFSWTTAAWEGELQ
ncbi:MAG: dTDP-4-dehydrorhamnose 3,5-epimerase [Desulfomicrobiaceae bacterium]|nr:dTDP-4-dehydrorhamnose 3,5-epimerase [Desulfomicrobiaceae bacterium]